MKKIIFLFLFLIFLSCFPVFIGGGYVAWQIYAGNYSDFEKTRIIDILSKETVLYYADGQSQLGSLFGQEHRIYVTVDQIPKTMKDAIVSALKDFEGQVFESVQCQKAARRFDTQIFEKQMNRVVKHLYTASHI